MGSCIERHANPIEQQRVRQASRSFSLHQGKTSRRAATKPGCHLPWLLRFARDKFNANDLDSGSRFSNNSGILLIRLYQTNGRLNFRFGFRLRRQLFFRHRIVSSSALMRSDAG